MIGFKTYKVSFRIISLLIIFLLFIFAGYFLKKGFVAVYPFGTFEITKRGEQVISKKRVGSNKEPIIMFWSFYTILGGGALLAFYLNIITSFEMLILGKLLSEKQKLKTGFYGFHWQSKNFEDFLGADLKQLYQDAQIITEKSKAKVSDYAYLVLPYAKVYEGVLKKILVDAGVVPSSKLEEEPRIAISRFFDPQGNDRIFEVLKDKARDKAIPHLIYSTYQECRNQILHYDPFRDNRIKSKEEAVFFQKRIEDAIEKAYETFQNVKKVKRKGK